ncbi:MAG: hypothetical protein ABIP74_00685 [Candidatus Saccharimonas sp.]
MIISNLSLASTSAGTYSPAEKTHTAAALVTNKKTAVSGTCVIMTSAPLRCLLAIITLGVP